MKKLLQKRTTGSIRLQVLILLAVCGLQVTMSSAQSDSRVPQNDPVQQFISENPQHPLVKFYSEYPQDELSGRAIKFAAVTAKPEAFDDLDEIALRNIRSELEIAMKRVEYMSAQIAGGASFDHANALYNRNAPELFKMNEEVQQQAEPSIIAAPGN